MQDLASEFSKILRRWYTRTSEREGAKIKAKECSF